MGKQGKTSHSLKVRPEEHLKRETMKFGHGWQERAEGLLQTSVNEAEL